MFERPDPDGGLSVKMHLVRQPVRPLSIVAAYRSQHFDNVGKRVMLVVFYDHVLTRHLPRLAGRRRPTLFRDALRPTDDLGRICNLDSHINPSRNRWIPSTRSIYANPVVQAVNGKAPSLVRLISHIADLRLTACFIHRRTSPCPLELPSCSL